MGFWGSLFGGSNPTLSKDINQFGAIGGFASGLGQSNLTQGSQFWSSILSGDQSKIAKTLGPELGSLQKQGQQAKATTAQFNNRSGGTNSSMQTVGDKTRAAQNDMVNGLLGSAANSLMSSGSNLLGTALNAYGNQVDASQLQMQNWQNSLFGKSLSTGVGFGEGFALGKV